jgi:transcriptional accessory protein Tex/SPT6
MSAMVPLSLLEDDHYRHDPVAKQIAGRRQRRFIRLGDTVEVEIAKVDTVRKMIDFRLAGTVNGASAAASRGHSRHRGGDRTAQPHRPVAPVAGSSPVAAEGASTRRRRRPRRRGGKAKAA